MYDCSSSLDGPVDDPRIIVLVSIRKPNTKLRKGYAGGTVAALVAGAILDKTLTYLGVPPQPKDPNHKGFIASDHWAPRLENPEQENSW